MMLNEHRSNEEFVDEEDLLKARCLALCCDPFRNYSLRTCGTAQHAALVSGAVHPRIVVVLEAGKQAAIFSLASSFGFPAPVCVFNTEPFALFSTSPNTGMESACRTHSGTFKCSVVGKLLFTSEYCIQPYELHAREDLCKNVSRWNYEN